MIWDYLTILGGEDKTDAFKTHKEKDNYKPRTADTAKPTIKFEGAILVIFLTWDSLQIKMPPCNLWQEAIKILLHQNERISEGRRREEISEMQYATQERHSKSRDGSCSEHTTINSHQSKRKDKSKTEASKGRQGERRQEKGKELRYLCKEEFYVPSEDWRR